MAIIAPRDAKITNKDREYIGGTETIKFIALLLQDHYISEKSSKSQNPM